MKTMILVLAFIGTSMAALVPVAPPVLANFVGTRQNYLSTLQPQSYQIAAYDTAFPQPQYLVYNVPQVNTGVRTIPTAVFENGRPTIAHIPTTYNYYGTPVYDFRFPLNPVFPGVKPISPGFIPKPELPQYPEKPADDDGIEKLDEKVDPGTNENSSVENADDDTVVVEAD